jgi:hypothetical protein
VQIPAAKGTVVSGPTKNLMLRWVECPLLGEKQTCVASDNHVYRNQPGSSFNASNFNSPLKLAFTGAFHHNGEWDE